MLVISLQNSNREISLWQWKPISGKRAVWEYNVELDYLGCNKFPKLHHS